MSCCTEIYGNAVFLVMPEFQDSPYVSRVDATGNCVILSFFAGASLYLKFVYHFELVIFACQVKISLSGYGFFLVAICFILRIFSNLVRYKRDHSYCWCPTLFAFEFSLCQRNDSLAV